LSFLTCFPPYFNNEHPYFLLLSYDKRGRIGRALNFTNEELEETQLPMEELEEVKTWKKLDELSFLVEELERLFVL